MPFTKEQMKEYRQANKEKIKEQQKEYREANKEKIKEYQKKYYEANKQKKKEYKKEYNQTENGKKSNRISDWKSNGVISDDYDALYEKYINTNECELCSISIICGSGITNKKHLDHCHLTGEFRNILCGDCNIKRYEK
jgi:acetyl-CoA carboxylase carboxyltransferase component